jgi:hypothetical protein
MSTSSVYLSRVSRYGSSPLCKSDMRRAVFLYVAYMIQGCIPPGNYFTSSLSIRITEGIVFCSSGLCQLTRRRDCEISMTSAPTLHWKTNYQLLIFGVCEAWVLRDRQQRLQDSFIVHFVQALAYSRKLQDCTV